LPGLFFFFVFYVPMRADHLLFVLRQASLPEHPHTTPLAVVRLLRGKLSSWRHSPKPPPCLLFAFLPPRYADPRVSFQVSPLFDDFSLARIIFLICCDVYSLGVSYARLTMVSRSCAPVPWTMPRGHSARFSFPTPVELSLWRLLPVNRPLLGLSTSPDYLAIFFLKPVLLFVVLLVCHSTGNLFGGMVYIFFLRFQSALPVFVISFLCWTALLLAGALFFS